MCWPALLDARSTARLRRRPELMPGDDWNPSEGVVRALIERTIERFQQREHCDAERIARVTCAAGLKSLQTLAAVLNDWPANLCSTCCRVTSAIRRVTSALCASS